MADEQTPPTNDHDGAAETEGTTLETSTIPNADLRHSSAVDAKDNGGATTRDDSHDLGVPMTQGSASEPQGPEDALGEGSKRGDYTDRVEGRHFTTEPVEGGGEPIRKYVDGSGKEVSANHKDAREIIVDYTPTPRLVDQTANVADIGEVEGKKGGVDTAPAAA